MSLTSLSFVSRICIPDSTAGAGLIFGWWLELSKAKPSLTCMLCTSYKEGAGCYAWMVGTSHGHEGRARLEPDKFQGALNVIRSQASTVYPVSGGNRFHFGNYLSNNRRG
jgi:hypothetical protein